MSAADHETALREAEEWLAGWDDAEDERVGGVTKPIRARLVDALVGLLRQTEQRAERAELELVEWRTSIATEKLQERAETAEAELRKSEQRVASAVIACNAAVTQAMKAEREVERLKRENQERETANAVVEEAGETVTPDYDAARRAVGEALGSLPEPLRREALAAYTIVRSEIGQFAASRRYLQRGWDEAEERREHYESALRLIAGEFPPLPLSDPGAIARGALDVISLRETVSADSENQVRETPQSGVEVEAGEA